MKKGNYKSAGKSSSFVILAGRNYVPQCRFKNDTDEKDRAWRLPALSVEDIKDIKTEEG